MNPEDLTAEAEIRHVLGRYRRGCDRLDMEMVRSCYFADATEDRGRYVGDVDGFIDWLGEVLAPLDGTWHLFGDPYIEVDGDIAYVETYSMGMHRLVAEKDEVAPGRFIPTRYCDRFERREGEWRIARRIAVYEGSYLAEPDPGFASPPRARRDRDDPAYRRDGGDR